MKTTFISFRSALLALLAATCVAAAQQQPQVAGDVFGAIISDIGTLQDMLAKNKATVLTMSSANGITLLHYAAKNNNAEAAYLLLKAGMDVNIKTDKNITPLHWAADNNAADTLRCLLREGADVNAKAVNGYTALHFMARKGHIDIGRFLIAAGADVNAQDNAGNTPLHLAYAHLFPDIARLLVDNGASPTIKNKNGRMPVRLADKETRPAEKTPAKPVEKPVAPVVVDPIAVISPPPRTPQQTVQQTVQKPVRVPESPAVAQPAATTTLSYDIYTETVAPAPTQPHSAYSEYVNSLDPAAPQAADPDTAALTFNDMVRLLAQDPRTLHYPNGDMYLGELRNGKFHGMGMLYKRAERQLYDGEWSRGKKKGVGTFTYANNDTYSGRWHNDVPHGKGVFAFRDNGGRITGTWKNGLLQNGSGEYRAADGTRLRGEWKNNQLVATYPAQ